MFNPSREQVRRFFSDAWRKHQERVPLSPLEAIALDWMIEHPEYHDVLDAPDEAMAADYSIDAAQGNPFLHLSMHLAIAEQLSIDQPPGIRAAFEALARRTGSTHGAAHETMECLVEVVWRAQRDRAAPDGEAYLDCMRRRAGSG